jgi:hypothetical protein
LTTRFSAFDHRQCRTVFHGTGRIIPFHLAKDDVVAIGGILTGEAF